MTTQPPHPVPVLFVHGLAGAADDWAKVAAELPAEVPTLAPPLPGLHESGPGSDRSLTSVTAGLAALVREDAEGPVDIVGHEWGATVALALAATRPELIRRLVVISGGWPPWLAPGPDLVAPGLSRWESLEAKGSPRRREFLAPAALSGAPRPERSLVIWGADARRLRPRRGEKVVSALGRFVDPATVEMVTFPGVGDEPHLTAAAAVGALLCDFLLAP